MSLKGKARRASTRREGSAHIIQVHGQICGVIPIPDYHTLSINFWHWINRHRMGVYHQVGDGGGLGRLRLVSKARQVLTLTKKGAFSSAHFHFDINIRRSRASDL